MKTKTAFFLVLTLLIGLASGSASQAGYDARPPVETTGEDDDGCGDASASEMTHTHFLAHSSPLRWLST